MIRSCHTFSSWCNAATFAAFVVMSSATINSVIAKNWNHGDGFWNVSGNWSPAAVPIGNEAVNIVFTDAAPRTVTYNVNAPPLGLLAIDLTGAGTDVSQLSMPSNNTLTAKGILIGGYNGITSTLSAGRGAMTQSAGTASTTSGFDLVLGYGAGSTGTYTLSGTGALVANQSEYVGLYGNGTFNHSAGTNTIATATGFFDIGTYAGSSGTYSLSGTGVLVVNTNERVGDAGTGVFNQTGGTHTMTASNYTLTLGALVNSSGTYNLSGTGVLSIPGAMFLGLNGTGNFNQSGGNFTVGDLAIANAAGGSSTGSGAYSLSDGSANVNGSLSCGGQGTGVLAVSGTGVLTVNSILTVNNTVGTTVNLSGGTINTGGLNLNGTPSRLNWTAGTLNFTQSVTWDSAAAGTSTSKAFGAALALGSDQTLMVTGNETIGGAGVFSLTLNSGGTHSVTGALTINTTGLIALNTGGIINTSSLNLNGTPSRLNWLGGTLNLTQSVTWDSAAAATTTSAAFGPALALGGDQTLMVTGNETLGGAGAFDLTLNTGGTHYVTGGITLSPTGTITQNAGSTLYAASITQAGGTVNGTLQNQGNFIYQAGLFHGRLINQGSLALAAPNFTLDDGVENDGTATVYAGQTLTTNGIGLDNEGTFRLAGGTLNTPSLTNHGSFVFDSGTLTITQPSAEASGSIVSNSHNTTINVDATGVWLGNPASFAGFNHQGILNVGNNAVTLSSAAYARLGILTSLAGGVITATNGVALATGSNLVGHGAVNARVTGALGSVIEADGALTLGDAASPAGVNFAGELRTKQFDVTLASSAAAGLGNLTTLGDGALPGTLSANNGYVVDFDEVITGYGTINSLNTLAKRATINGTVQGNSVNQPITLSGYIKGTGTFNNVVFSGTHDPGFSPTLLTVGSIRYSPSALLNMELGGTARGSQYDAIVASGSLDLGGTLQLSLISGFSPTAGDSFDILDWSSLSGSFSAIQLPVLGSALAWNTSQLYTIGVLSVASVGLPGDYNGNGVVDAADYVVWRKNQGTTHTLPNDSIGGTIGAAQYDQWRAHFGQPPGSGAGAIANAAVPEPATLVLLMVAAAGWCLRNEPHRKKSHQVISARYASSNDPRDTRFLKHENCVEKRRLATFETDLEYGLPQLHHLINVFWNGHDASGRCDRSAQWRI